MRKLGCDMGLAAHRATGALGRLCGVLARISRAAAVAKFGGRMGGTAPTAGLARPTWVWLAKHFVACDSNVGVKLFCSHSKSQPVNFFSAFRHQTATFHPVTDKDLFRNIRRIHIPLSKCAHGSHKDVFE